MKNLGILLIATFLLSFTFKPLDPLYKGSFKVGNPYSIAGRDYIPEIDNSYSEIGVASWYGDKFHNKKTANGEAFNKNELTAAHKTLPLPSIVKVTNLDNGESLVVKVNDRGPFIGDRIIDLSEYAALQLGFMHRGTTEVVVEFLPEETNQLHIELFGQTYLD
ncbi:MAG: septal ring lytic transglycosylase RlpA family protein [Rickettsiales bacterium]|nr:septal ring lytic transglycosylase RlpA family protein [Rickettsiales bacterium]